MTTSGRRITVGGLAVDVVRKDIKNLHLGVYPPSGRVRVAAPQAMSDDAIRLAIVEKLGWIKRQRAAFVAQPRQSAREMMTGESHYFLGRRYRLRVHEEVGPARMALRGLRSLDLFVAPGTPSERRMLVLERWYREQLRALVPPLLAKWQRAIGVRPAGFRIRKMKTKWGSCSLTTRRIWLNLELAKTPMRCIEYIVVHELVHLNEPTHGERFTALMDRHLPDWRERRSELQGSVLGAQDWAY
jgi:predicted metal-dependent hydrolase